MTDLPIAGVYCASVTRITADFAPDHAAFVAHCRHLLDGRVWRVWSERLRARPCAPEL